MNNAAETGAEVATKLAPPATVTAASFAGVPVNELLLWATLVYTVLMIAHKVWQIWRDISRKEPA